MPSFARELLRLRARASTMHARRRAPLIDSKSAVNNSCVHTTAAWRARSVCLFVYLRASQSESEGALVYNNVGARARAAARRGEKYERTTGRGKKKSQEPLHIFARNVAYFALHALYHCDAASCAGFLGQTDNDKICGEPSDGGYFFLSP